MHNTMRTTFWQHRNVLVTGATGLLGPHLIQELLANNARIVALVRDFVPDSSFFTNNLDRAVTVVHGDLLDSDLIARCLNEFDIDTVFHLGAQAIVGYANRSPIATFRSNIEGTWKLLEACRLSPWVKHIIVASSDKAYGSHEILPYTEDAPLQGRHPYDVSKSCADLIAQSYFHTYKLPVCITRCGNFFGPGDLHLNRIVPGTIRSLINHQAPVIRSNGLFVRDYIYVKDVADAYMTLAEKMAPLQLFGHSFNFSTDEPFTVIEIVQHITKLMGITIDPIIENRATNEIPAQHLSSHKARTLLGWQPAYGVQKGLVEAIAWYKEYFRQDLHEKNLNFSSLLQREQEHSRTA